MIGRAGHTRRNPTSGSSRDWHGAARRRHTQAGTCTTPFCRTDTSSPLRLPSPCVRLARSPTRVLLVQQHSPFRDFTHNFSRTGRAPCIASQTPKYPIRHNAWLVAIAMASRTTEYMQQCTLCRHPLRYHISQRAFQDHSDCSGSRPCHTLWRMPGMLEHESKTHHGLHLPLPSPATALISTRLLMAGGRWLRRGLRATVRLSALAVKVVGGCTYQEIAGSAGWVTWERIWLQPNRSHKMSGSLVPDPCGIWQGRRQVPARRATPPNSPSVRHAHTHNQPPVVKRAPGSSPIQIPSALPPLLSPIQISHPNHRPHTNRRHIQTTRKP